MALPKQKTTKVRKNNRRSHHALKPQALVDCPQCGNPKLPHHVCKECGTYNGKEILETETKAKKEEK